MGSPTQGAWECRHGVDGRDHCPDCHPEHPAELARALNLAAEGREEYAERSTHEEHRQFLLGEAAAFRSAARLIESGNVNGFLASVLPSWRWPKEVDAYVMRDNPHYVPLIDG